MIGVYATGGREPRHARERDGDPWKRIATVVLHREPIPAVRDAHRHAPGSRVAGVLEQVDEDLLHFVSPGGGERAGVTGERDRGGGFRAAQRVQVYDFARHGMDVDGLERER